MTHAEILLKLKDMQEQANLDYNNTEVYKHEMAQRWNELKITEKIILEILDKHLEE